MLDELQYRKLADETLEELGQFFEDLGDTGLCPSDYDVSLAVSLCIFRAGIAVRMQGICMYACLCLLIVVCVL